MAWENKVAQKDAVKAFLVAKDGKVNLAASVARFEQAAISHIAKHEGEETSIKESLTNLFATYKGASLNAAAIASGVIERMKKQVPELGHPSLYPFLAKRIDEVVHADLGDRASGKTYGMKKGLGGGFFVWADQAPES
jgi:hypothetical protein